MVPDELVENIKVRESQHWNKLLSDMIRPLRKDDSVRITDGPFSGLEAVFEKPLSASGRVQVLIEILGQTTRVSLNSNSLARIDWRIVEGIVQAVKITVNSYLRKAAIEIPRLSVLKPGSLIFEVTKLYPVFLVYISGNKVEVQR